MALALLMAAVRVQGGVLALFVDAVAAHLPLTAHQRAPVPAGCCPHLGRALPAALAHSEHQASQLVRRLSVRDRA